MALLSVICLYDIALNNLWCAIQRGDEIDTKLFKRIDAVANGSVDFFVEGLNQISYLKSSITNEYKNIKKSKK